MPRSLRAVIHAGKIEPLDDVSFPEGSKVLVTLLPDELAEFWSGASRSSLDALWDNPADDVYGQLLKE